MKQWVSIPACLAWLLASAYAQELVGTGAVGIAAQGQSVAISADGNTALVGGTEDNNNAGAVWVYADSNGVWTQQGPKLEGSQAVGPFVEQGTSVALSQDGSTAAVGGPGDSNQVGAAWVFTRAGGIWSEQAKLVGAGAAGQSRQGTSVALSADGNTLLVGGTTDNKYAGAVWVFTRSNGVWTQQGDKLVGSGAVNLPVGFFGPTGATQGGAVASSADGNTALVGGDNDSAGAGAVWVFTRTNGVWTQQGGKLVGSGAVAVGIYPSGPVVMQGSSVALAADGNTALVGAPRDDLFTGAVWVFTRSDGTWTQQGGKLVAASAAASNLGDEGASVALSGDGNTALLGPGMWVFKRTSGAWTEQGGPLTPAGTSGNLGYSVSLSADGQTALAGSALQNNGNGAAWVLALSSGPGVPAPGGVTPAAGSAASRQMTFTFTDTAGYQNLGVMNVLINNALDGRSACYLAYVESMNLLYLVDDDGATLLPGKYLYSAGSLGNSQCAVTWGNAPVSGAGSALTLTLAMEFNTTFSGNKLVYMAARDAAGTNSGWHPLGVWRVPGAPAAAISANGGVSPSRGSGRTQTFNFTFSDTNGYMDLGIANVLVNSAIDGRNACYLAYSRPLDVLYLVSDGGNGLLPGLTLNVPGTIGNNQCTVTWGNSAVSAGGNNLALTFAVTFSAAFRGDRIFYLAARNTAEANNTGWQAVGTWSVQ